MANANAIVEKLKELGLRHGEKAGVAIASMAFFVCVGMAANQKTIDTTPEQIKKAARHRRAISTARRNERRSSRSSSEKGIKDSRFRQGRRRAGQDGARRRQLQGRLASGSLPSRVRA